MQRVMQCVAVLSHMADEVALVAGPLAFLDRYDRSFSVLQCVLQRVLQSVAL